MSMPRWDVIIIGSGAGGSAAAHSLVNAGRSVLLLEKGGHLPADGSTLDVQRVVHGGEFLSQEPWTDGRGGTLRPEEHFNVGGKTKWYGAAVLRFGRHEFGPDTDHGCAGWPLALESLEPYYRRAEELLGVRTFDREPALARILRRCAPPGGAWRALPMPMSLSPDILAHTDEAAHFDGFASPLGLKGEAERSLLGALHGKDGFQLVPNAEVIDLLGDRASPTVVQGVRLRDGREFRASQVLLAAGALHSPRLLARYLRSTGLDSGLPVARQVGRNLKLHLLTAVVAVSPRRIDDLVRKTALIVNDSYPHSSAQPLGFDAELIASLMPSWLPKSLARAVGRRAYGFFLQTEDGSDERNCVHDGKGIGPPVLDYDESRLPASVREHRTFTRALQRCLARAGLISFTRRIGLNGTAHACGTLRCGSHAADSVVDAEARVHGMQGLYVVDGSVLPRSSSVNPSLTIYAWGLRAGELIARTAPVTGRTAAAFEPVETTHA
jgi:choline dehydrogenase-like flavoprotein